MNDVVHGFGIIRQAMERKDKPSIIVLHSLLCILYTCMHEGLCRPAEPGGRGGRGRGVCACLSAREGIQRIVPYQFYSLVHPAVQRGGGM